MSNPLIGIKQILPTYPVKPARPAKEQESDERQRRPDDSEPVRDRDDESETGTETENGERKPTIDEYI
ncbi:MAG: hypothetical protein WD672_04125 [Woeseia sp.]